MEQTNKINYKTPERIGYQLHFSDGSTTKVVTKGYGVATILIDGVQHNIVTSLSERGPSVQVVTNLVSEEISLHSAEESGAGMLYDKEVKLQFPSAVVKISLFDASGIDLCKPPGPTTITATGDGTFRTCGTCGGRIYCVTNACHPCNGGWLCDNKEAPS